MDSETAKQILSAYRQNSLDNESAAFLEALEYCRENPEMEAWLTEEQSLDTKMAAALRSIKAPPSGKDAILATAFLGDKQSPSKSPGGRRIFRRLWTLGAVAASVTVAALTWLTFNPSATGQATYELAQHAHDIATLDFADSSVPALATWLREQGAPSTEGLPSSLHDEEAVGCTVFKDSLGRPVSMICLQVDGGLVHVFIMDKASPIANELPQDTWVAADGLNMYSWSTGDVAYAITTEMDPATIDAALGKSLHRAAS